MPNPVAANVGGYRPDLDGLRGIAVAAVVAYHLELPFATGGFVGVDVFFVLSGYLITRLIAEEMRSGAFSLTRFYERRIRRIVPAMVFVCACTTAMAIAFLLPDELKRYSSSLIAAAFSYSNVWFFDNSGYFDPGSGTQPLLHTWSLGIEEQFYIVFPLLLLAVFRWRPRALGTVIWLAFAASLVASVVLLPEHPAATFYLLHTRAWELLTGSILALGLLPRPASQAQREIAFAAGIVAIAVAVFGFASKTPFPGASALLPCIGTALAIWASEGGEAAGSRFLKFRPLMFLGLISYSLYLWHWPLIVFTKLATSKHLAWTEQVSLAVVMVGLAIFTWHFVELPFRRGGAGAFSRHAIFASGTLGLGALAASAWALIALGGIPERFPETVLQIAAAREDASPLREKCHSHAGSKSFDDTCVLGDDVAPSVIVYGDSHGAEFSAVLGEFAKPRHASVRQITASGCPPASGFTYARRSACSEYNDRMLERLTSIAPSTVVLASYSLTWSREFPDQFWPGIERTIIALRGAGHRVIVLGPVPDLPSASGIPAAVARWAALGGDPSDYSFEQHDDEIHDVEARLSTIATAQGAIFLPISQEICSGSRCKAYQDGAVLYFDNNHLSRSGAQLIASRLLVPVIWPEPELSGMHASAP